MKWKDSGHSGDTHTESEQEYRNEFEYSPLKRTKISSFVQELFKTTEVPKVWLGLGVLIVIVLIVVVALSGLRKAPNVNRIKDFEEKVRKLEDRLNAFENIDQKLSLLASQDRKIDRLSKRVAHLESLASGKTNQSGKTVERKTQVQYYQVKTGDTLYSISRRYGLTVDELRKLNQLTPKSVIYPGQKLLIKP